MKVTLWVLTQEKTPQFLVDQIQNFIWGCKNLNFLNFSHQNYCSCFFSQPFNNLKKNHSISWVVPNQGSQDLGVSQGLSTRCNCLVGSEGDGLFSVGVTLIGLIQLFTTASLAVSNP